MAQVVILLLAALGLVAGLPLEDNDRKTRIFGYGATGYGATGYGSTGYGATSYGSTGYGATGYGSTGYGYEK